MRCIWVLLQFLIGRRTPPTEPPADPPLPNWWDVTLESQWWNRHVRHSWWRNLFDVDADEKFKTSSYSYERRHIQNGLELRYSLLEAATLRLSASINRTGLRDAAEAGAPRAFSIPAVCVWQLATIDVFVEKAQHFLTQRADKQECYGMLTVIATLATMVVPICLTYRCFFGVTSSKISDFTQFLEFVTVLAPIFGIAYFFTSLTRAFFHEATILRNRRHSVRLGRLLLHLKVSSATSADGLAKIIEGLDISEVERSFGWNLETSTAFKDINAEVMTTGLLNQMWGVAKSRKDGEPKKSEKGGEPKK